MSDKMIMFDGVGIKEDDIIAKGYVPAPSEPPREYRTIDGPGISFVELHPDDPLNPNMWDYGAKYVQGSYSPKGFTNRGYESWARRYVTELRVFADKVEALLNE